MIEIRRFLVAVCCVTCIICQMEPFIVGGNRAKITHYPHSVFLYISCVDIKVDVKNDWVCGGSIVNELIVLTAAHCVYGCSSKSVLTVSSGHFHRLQGFESSVRTYLIHERYSASKISNDIALLQLRTRLEFGKTVKRVAFMKNPPYYERAQVAGWGMINEDKEIMSAYLMYVNQLVWTKSACRQVISSTPKGTICASSGNATSYSSRGDSGSALVVRGYIQIGIVSFKMPKISKSLVVYTDTGFFYNWIRKNSKKLYCVMERT